MILDRAVYLGVTKFCSGELLIGTSHTMTGTTR